MLAGDKLEELDDLRADLEHHRPEGMTDKNLTAIRTFMQSDAWRALHHLPDVLMGEAKEASYPLPSRLRCGHKWPSRSRSSMSRRSGGAISAAIRIERESHSNGGTANALPARFSEL